MHRIFLKIKKRLQYITFKLRVRNVKFSTVDLENFCKTFADIDYYDPLVDDANDLRNRLLDEYANKYNSLPIKILISVPAKSVSPGGYSIFTNWIETLSFMGVDTVGVSIDNIHKEIDVNKKNWLFISDDENVDRLNKTELMPLIESGTLNIIMSASSEIDGNTKNETRIKRALDWGVKFFVSYRTSSFNKIYLKEWKEHGFDVISIPFAANVIKYYPININKVFDFVFLASTNPDKCERYNEYLVKIFNEHNGIIDGPGWIGNSSLSSEYHAIAYSASKVGINLHIPISIDVHSEINERSFILAACCTLQISDNAKAFPEFFREGSVFICNTPEMYFKTINRILANYSNYDHVRKQALEDVYNRNTYFHRMDLLIERIRKDD